MVNNERWYQEVLNLHKFITSIGASLNLDALKLAENDDFFDLDLSLFFDSV